MKSATIKFNYTTKTGKTKGQTRERKIFVMEDNGTQISGFDLTLLSPFERIQLPFKYRKHKVTSGPTGGHLKGYNKYKKAWRKFDKVDMMFN